MTSFISFHCNPFEKNIRQKDIPQINKERFDRERVLKYDIVIKSRGMDGGQFSLLKKDRRN